MFTRMLEQARRAPDHFTDLAATLSRGMAKGGLVGIEPVDWVNGGLFDDDATLALERADVDAVLAASKLDWSEIDPSILGTLFERGLDPGKRAQLGAHYTDRDKIARDDDTTFGILPAGSTSSGRSGSGPVSKTARVTRRAPRSRRSRSRPA